MEVSQSRHYTDYPFTQREQKSLIHNQPTTETSKPQPSIDYPFTKNEQEFLTQQQERIEEATRKLLEESQILTQELGETFQNLSAKMDRYQETIEEATRKLLEESRKSTQELEEKVQNLRAEMDRYWETREQYRKTHEDLHKHISPPVTQKNSNITSTSQSYNWCVVA